MEMIKVDPKLFVTCRLCLEETGMYQITPLVQHQIKFCFDITVDQYDGLPQLICGQCETVLSEYFTKKRIYVGRQNALKTKLQVLKEVESSLCPSPPHEAVSSSQPNENDELNNRRKSTSKPKKRKLRIISSSSSSSAPDSRSASPSPAINNDIPTTGNKSHKKRLTKNRRESWEAHYTKGYACKFCNKFLKYGTRIGNHLKTHVYLISKYHDIINRSCKVELIKIDGKPNLTGDNNTVVLSKDRIIGQQKENLCVLYLSQKDCSTTENTESAMFDVTHVELDDEDGILRKSKQVKRRRVLSRSSTDTVVLNGDNKSASDAESGSKRADSKSAKHDDAEIECINIDDSSNGSQQSDSMSLKDNDNVPVKPKDVEAIKNLIRVCHNKYVSKKQELIETSTKKAANKGPQLKKKLLNMGLKLINRQGVNCTGLLRFMERKNLVVKWIPTANKETNYVRVIARLKGREELGPDNLGWKKKPEVTENILDILPLKKDFFTTSESEKQSETNVNVNNSRAISGNNHPVNENSSKVATIISGVTRNSNEVENASSAVAVEDNYSSESILFQDLDKKLLNANPVANPKQLPKKCTIPDTKLLTQTLIEKVVQQNYAQLNASNNSVCIDLVVDQQADSEMCMPMPIITSTTSLAGPSTNEIQMNTSDNGNKNPTSSTENNEALEKPAPRIKVKPFSELMSERVLKNIGQHQSTVDNIWAPNTSMPAGPASGSLLNMTRMTPGHVPVDSAQVVPATDSNALTVATTRRSYVILDTVELPNTKTESPITYIKNLLQTHNIILLESHESLPSTANCLVKFKLKLRDAVNQPVTLCLSVHCADNLFCLGVRDPNEVNYIDLHKLSANWQWEILKIYTIRQDVINKMLQNAQKMNQKEYDYTKTFLCLLKSINFKNDDV